MPPIHGATGDDFHFHCIRGDESDNDDCSILSVSTHRTNLTRETSRRSIVTESSFESPLRRETSRRSIWTESSVESSLAEDHAELIESVCSFVFDVDHDVTIEEMKLYPLMNRR